MSGQHEEICRKLHHLEWVRHDVHCRALKDSGVYFGQPPILELLVKNGTCTQNELARALHVSPASVAVSLKRMQKSGLVKKAADESDLRCNRVSITDLGREQIGRIHACLDEIDHTMLAGFSAEELSALGSYLDRLCANLSADIPKEKDLHEMRGDTFCTGGKDRYGETD